MTWTNSTLIQRLRLGRLSIGQVSSNQHAHNHGHPCSISTFPSPPAAIRLLLLILWLESRLAPCRTSALDTVSTHLGRSIKYLLDPCIFLGSGCSGKSLLPAFISERVRKNDEPKELACMVVWEICSTATARPPDPRQTATRATWKTFC